MHELALIEGMVGRVVERGDARIARVIDLAWSGFARGEPADREIAAFFAELDAGGQLA